MTGHTNVGGGSLPVKSVKFEFKQSESYDRPFQTQYIDTAMYYSYPVDHPTEKDNIQITTGQITRWFCKEMTYVGQVLGYKINGIYYPIFNLKAEGIGLILRDLFSIRVKQISHVFYEEDIAFLLDAVKRTVQVGARNQTTREPWVPTKDYSVEIFYMPDP